MATLAGNVGFKVSSRLQFRGLLIPWVSKKNSILCVKGRDYSSSLPIRYVPKKSVNIKESENSVLKKGLERHEPLKQSFSKASELRIGLSGTGGGLKKSAKVNESENITPVIGLERNEPCKHSDGNELRVEVSNTRRDVKESVRINESENSVVIGLERNEVRKGSDASKFRFEVSNIEIDVKKPLKINEPENYLPVNISGRNELRELSDATKSRIEVSNSGRDVKKTLRMNKTEDPLQVNSLDRNVPQKQSDASEFRIGFSNSEREVKRSISSDTKFQYHNRMTNNNSLLDVSNQEFVGDINCEHELIEESEVSEEPWEVVEEMEDHQQNDIYLQAAKVRQDAEIQAIKLLATRAFTAVEMRKKLNGKKFPSHVIEAVITDFQSRGLIDDCLYAESYSRSRWSSASWGPRRIKQALFSKGISQTDADKAVNLVFKDGESEEDQELRLGMSKHSIDHLFVQASKQWLRSKDAPEETRKSRIIRWLQYRGFNWGVTSFILKKLQSQYPS